MRVVYKLTKRCFIIGLTMFAVIGSSGVPSKNFHWYASGFYTRYAWNSFMGPQKFKTSSPWPWIQFSTVFLNESYNKVYFSLFSSSLPEKRVSIFGMAGFYSTMFCTCGLPSFSFMFAAFCYPNPGFCGGFCGGFYGLPSWKFYGSPSMFLRSTFPPLGKALDDDEDDIFEEK